MNPVSSVTVTVPATTANLGPGFDCLGAALSLRNQFTFSTLPPGQTGLVITATGLEAERVLTTADNLVYQTFCQVYARLGQAPPPVQLDIQLNVPLTRGLGSSATAIVGGLVGANQLAGAPLTTDDLMQMAIDLEGHPDNVVPALIGGCRLAATGLQTPWEICEVPWHSSIVPIVAIPDFELSTQAARQVLPPNYSRADAIFNTAHLGLLLRGLETGQVEWLRAALQDRIHQPYRQSLILGYEAVREAALGAGAYGVVISGAGPTLLTLANSEAAQQIRSALMATWASVGIKANVQVLQVETEGAIVA